VIVHNLDVNRIRIGPAKTDPPLVVDSDTELSSPVTRKGFQTIPRNYSQIRERRGSMELVQLSFCYARNALILPAELTTENFFGLLIPERPNHKSRLLPLRVKCNAGYDRLLNKCGLLKS